MNISKLFHEAVASGEVKFTNKEFIASQVRMGYKSAQKGEYFSHEEIVGADSIREYTYKGHLSAEYISDSKKLSYNSVEIGDVFYGIFQLEQEVGEEIAFSNIEKAMEEYTTIVLARKAEAVRKAEEAFLAKEARKAEMMEKFPLLKGHYNTFFYNEKDNKVLSEDKEEFEVKLKEDNLLGFYDNSKSFHLFVDGVEKSNFEYFRLFVQRGWEKNSIDEIKKVDGVYTDGKAIIPSYAKDSYLKYQDVIFENHCNFFLDKSSNIQFNNYNGKAKFETIILNRKSFVLVNPVVKNGTLFLNVPYDIAGLVIGKGGANLQKLISDWNSDHRFEEELLITKVKVNPVKAVTNQSLIEKMEEFTK